jgi:DNA helicase IV
MALGIKLVYDLLMNDQGIGNMMNKDMIFTVEVPEDYQKAENAPIILISDISDFNEQYVNNKPFTNVTSIQISVWARDLKTLDQFKDYLDELLANNNWSQYTGTLYKDPDIELFMLARRYRTTQILLDFNKPPD